MHKVDAPIATAAIAACPIASCAPDTAELKTLLAKLSLLLAGSLHELYAPKQKDVRAVIFNVSGFASPLKDNFFDNTPWVAMLRGIVRYFNLLFVFQIDAKVKIAGIANRAGLVEMLLLT